MTKHFKEALQMQDICFTVHTFKEGKTYVAYPPELDLSSCGATDEDYHLSAMTRIPPAARPPNPHLLRKTEGDTVSLDKRNKIG
jgi:hypothetical protein